MNQQHTPPRCLFCQSDQFKSTVFEDTLFNGKVFHYLQCKSCHLVYVNPLPTLEDYVAMYPVTYQGKIKTQGDGCYDALLNRIKETVPKGRLLDYGCGNGRFVVEALQHGFEVSATEFSADLIKVLTSEIPQAAFHTIDDFWKAEGKYEVIFMSNVLEHLSNPKEIFDQLIERLTPNGVFVLEGPIEDNMNLAQSFRKVMFGTRKKLFKKKASHAPRHIFYSNGKNQLQFFERAGLDTLYYAIDEQPWPFPASKSQANGMKNKLLYFVASTSMAMSKRKRNWGNIFTYIGKKS